jgi:mono/diheme cytochrome c family protein
MITGTAKVGHHAGNGAIQRLVAAAVLIAGATVGSVHAVSPGTPAPQAAGGAYTDAQSTRGEEVSEKGCVSCHGPKLSGTDVGPTLQGDYFMMIWGGKSAGDLFAKIHDTMPADAPGSLTPQQVVDLIAYVFKQNNFPSGATELSTDSAALDKVKIAR